MDAAGIETYLYEEHSSPGESISARLQRAISESDALVALLTPHSGPSGYVHQEIGFALGAKKVAVALVAPGVDHRVLAMLNEREYIAFDPRDAVSGIARLMEFLQAQAAAQRRRQQEELFNAIVLIAIALMLSYAVAQNKGSI